MPTTIVKWEWEDAFSKFGFGDGDGENYTNDVADAIAGEFGYECNCTEWGIHNYMIMGISDPETRASVYKPCGNKEWVIGYDDPRDYLPDAVVAFLDKTFPADTPPEKKADAPVLDAAGCRERDRSYMVAAKLHSRLSHDIMKVGALIVSPDGWTTYALGHNRFTAGVENDTKYWQDREVKLALVQHAEANAICNAALVGHALNGCTMYLYGLPPCAECAKLIVQSGITRLVYRTKIDESRLPEPWNMSCKLALELMRRAGVGVERYDETLVEDDDA